MKQLFANLTLFLLVMMLSACVFHAHSPGNTPLTACMMKCQQSALQCKKTCYNNCPGCCRRANSMANKNFSRYKHEEIVKGGQVVRQAKSYRDPLKCKKTSCDCRADYQICVQTCGGVRLRKTLQAVPQCDVLGTPG